MLISDGILNRGILNAVGKGPGTQDQDEDFRMKSRQAFDGTGLDFVFPHGSTISVSKPAVPIMSSGKIAYPMNRPLGEWPLTQSLQSSSRPPRTCSCTTVT